MKQTRKGKNWRFGMKLHIGTDRRGMVHSLTATHAAESGIKQLWGFSKTRYRGIAKNLARAQTMFALASLYAVRHRLFNAACAEVP